MSTYSDLFGPGYHDLPAGFCQNLLTAPAGGGLTLREALIMHMVITAKAPPTVGALAKLISAPQPSASRCIARLEAMGYLLRTRGLRNQRHVSPTMKGQELLE